MGSAGKGAGEIKGGNGAGVLGVWWGGEVLGEVLGIVGGGGWCWGAGVTR